MIVENLLILGSPRSGTTLIAAILSGHPEICILMEDFYGSDSNILSKKIKGVKLCVPNQIELTKRSTFMKRLMKRLALLKDLPGIRNMPLSRFSIRDYQRMRKNLHIIGIIRNPISVIGSIQKRGSQNLKTAEYRWARCIDVLYELMAENKSQVSVVSFEDIVLKPKRVISSLLSHINVTYEDTILNGYKHTPQYNSNSIDQSKACLEPSTHYRFNCLKNPEVTIERYNYLINRCL